MRIRTADGRTVEFDEQPTYQPWPTPVEARRLPSGASYLRLRGFPAGVNGLVDGALSDLAATDRLIIDLRGNPGGSLVEAFDFRDRFLDRPRQTGWIRFSTPTGGLSPPAPVEAEPAPPRRRWTGQVRFLTDGLTASASEDAILGLAGLPHVQILGTATGGGSGRARNIRLLPGIRLTVSTALTYDRDKRCVENHGIQPDIRVDESTTETDEIIRVADDTW